MELVALGLRISWSVGWGVFLLLAGFFAVLLRGGVWIVRMHPRVSWSVSDPVGFMYTVVQSFGFVVYAHNLRVYGVQSMSMMISTLISSLHVRTYFVAVRFFSIAEVAPWRGAAVSSMVVEFPAPAALGYQWTAEPPRIWTMLPNLPNSRHSSVGGCGRLRRSPGCRVRWEAGPRCWLWRVRGCSLWGERRSVGGRMHPLLHPV